MTLMDGCLTPEPTRRLTMPHVLDTLTALHYDATRISAASAEATGSFARVASGRGGGRGGPGGTSSSSVHVTVPPPSLPLNLKAPSPSPARSPTYDVLAIIDAMEALGIDPVAVSAVENAVGTSVMSTLDSLVANKVPIMKIAAVRRAVAPPHPATTSELVRF